MRLSAQRVKLELLLNSNACPDDSTPREMCMVNQYFHCNTKIINTIAHNAIYYYTILNICRYVSKSYTTVLIFFVDKHFRVQYDLST